MRPDQLTGRLAVTGIAVLALALAGCGEASAPEPGAKAKPAAAKLDPNKGPHEITCADLADPLAAAQLSRRATVKLARRADIAGLSELRASQSIYFAMTELCKDGDESYRPAADAVAAVERGEYRADLGAP